MKRNGGWSGKATFTYEVEREGKEVALTVTGTAFFEPGKNYGRPEDCYPDEGDQEIEEVTGPDGADWLDRLTASEKEFIMERLVERCQEGNEPDPDIDYDSRFDRLDFDYPEHW